MLSGEKEISWVEIRQELNVGSEGELEVIVREVCSVPSAGCI